MLFNEFHASKKDRKGANTNKFISLVELYYTINTKKIYKLITKTLYSSAATKWH